jgi:oxygen-independent coproporphyrinogen-3 oxidase
MSTQNPNTNREILLKYNKPGPRYTSYPPATFFTEKYTEAHYIESLKESNHTKPENISLYVHVPFCPRLCHFCGCNTEYSNDPKFIERYIDALILEIDKTAALLYDHRPVTQIHWGGGTPNAIDYKHIERVMRVFFKKFEIAENAEIAMECNPAELEFEHIDLLAEFGFNRLSLGIQDFDAKVLKIVNRAPSKHPVEKLVERMKDNEFAGVNLDFIYGLPGQTTESFAENMKRAVEINPDRIVTFSYAHVPWVKSAQNILEKTGLPSPEEKLAMFLTALDILTQNGYTAIGMDHYAKSDDDLSHALEHKKLHRNFQGYCTRETTGQVYGFGATSIHQLTNAYAQNIKSTKKYIETIESGHFAVERGYELITEDIVRRDVINEIMCNGYLNLDDMSKHFSISREELIKITDFKSEKLNPFIEDKLLTFDGNTLQIEGNGFMVVRNIAMIFDPLLKDTEGKYSKTL